jgi:hypothetical protein
MKEFRALRIHIACRLLSKGVCFHPLKWGGTNLLRRLMVKSHEILDPRWWHVHFSALNKKSM